MRQTIALLAILLLSACSQSDDASCGAVGAGVAGLTREANECVGTLSRMIANSRDTPSSLAATVLNICAPAIDPGVVKTKKQGRPPTSPETWAATRRAAIAMIVEERAGHCAKWGKHE